MDAGPGGLGRQGAVRKRRGDVHEMNGHKFVQTQFYQPILCALCQEFLRTGEGFQCEDCRYACHKRCYPKVVTKCISKSNADTVSRVFYPIRLSLIFDLRRATRKKSTIEFRIGSSPSAILAPVGAVTAVICYPLAKRMLGNAQSVPLLATPPVCTWFQTFAA